MKISCPDCKRKYEIDESYINQQVECKCGRSFTVDSLMIQDDEEVVSASLKILDSESSNVVLEITHTTAGPSKKIMVIRLIIGIILVPVFGIGLIFIFWAIWEYYAMTYTLTNKRIMVTHGVIIKNESAINIKDIRGIMVKRTLFDAICGTGTLEIGTAAMSGVEVILPHIDNPKGLQATINKMS